LKRLIAAELRKDAAHADVDLGSSIILKTEPGWWATLRNDGSRRLAAGFELAGTTR